MSDTLRFEPLTRAATVANLERLMELDATTMGEEWTRRHWLAERPGKWELSRLAYDDAADHVIGAVVASMKPGSVHVHRLVVAVECRGRGVGSRLMVEIAVAALKAEREAVTVSSSPLNEGAQRLYTRLGCHPIQSLPWKVVMRAESAELSGVLRKRAVT